MGGRRTGFRRGDLVRVERDEVLHPPAGTWPRYRGREGTVVVAANYGEVGVRFGRANRSLTYFLPHELTLLHERTGRPQSRQGDEPAEGGP